jgi:hypothetical protein
MLKRCVLAKETAIRLTLIVAFVLVTAHVKAVANVSATIVVQAFIVKSIAEHQPTVRFVLDMVDAYAMT